MFRVSRSEDGKTMDGNDDLRWIQRLNNFSKALRRLQEANRLSEIRALSDLEQQGAIKAFEFCYELGWNVLKDYLEWQGATNLPGSRTVIRVAFKAGLIENGEAWINMVEDRKLTTHAYDESIARRIFSGIRETYLPLFEVLKRQMQALRNEPDL